MTAQHDVDPVLVRWRTSARSGSGGGNCVEAGRVEDGSGRVAVRHSHQRGGRIIAYSRTDWDAFVTEAKDGAFDF